MDNENADSPLLRLELENTRRELERRVSEMEAIYRAGIALSSQRDTQSLYHLILQTGRSLTNSDAATLYIVEQTDGGQVLEFSAAQNATVNAPDPLPTLPLADGSLAGFVALSGQSLKVDDAYSLPRDANFSFDGSFDRRFNYRTRSVLAAPMMSVEGEVVGVIQLINRKRNAETLLADLATVDAEVQPFTNEDERVVLALASQAAVAVENRRLVETNRLYRELQAYVTEVSKVITAAASVEAGTFEPDSLADVAIRRDALGQLARVFQQMAREVRSREQRLQQQVQQLRIVIDHAEENKQVAAITETDYFQALQRSARDLRDKA